MTTIDIQSQNQVYLCNRKQRAHIYENTVKRHGLPERQMFTICKRVKKNILLFQITGNTKLNLNSFMIKWPGFKQNGYMLVKGIFHNLVHIFQTEMFSRKLGYSKDNFVCHVHKILCNGGEQMQYSCLLPHIVA